MARLNFSFETADERSMRNRGPRQAGSGSAGAKEDQGPRLAGLGSAGAKERRNEVRMLCADMADVSWKLGTGARHEAVGLLEDISPSGACLQMECAIPVGAEICWRCRSREFSGRVRYCVYREIGYFVGIELAAACKWSKRAYKPRHLLDLHRLVR
jgi:hypothetical protein